MPIAPAISGAVAAGARLYSKVPPSAKAFMAEMATSAIEGQLNRPRNSSGGNGSPFAEAASRASGPNVRGRNRNTMTGRMAQAYHSPIGQALKNRALDVAATTLTESFQRNVSPQITMKAMRAMDNPAVRLAYRFFEPGLASAAAKMLEPPENPSFMDKVVLGIAREAVGAAAIAGAQYGIGTGFIPGHSNFTEDHRNLYDAGYSQGSSEARGDAPKEFDKARFEQRVKVIGRGVRKRLYDAAVQRSNRTPEELSKIETTLAKLKDVELGILNLETNRRRTATGAFQVDENGPTPFSIKEPAVAAYLVTYESIIQRIVNDQDLNQLIGGLRENV